MKAIETYYNGYRFRSRLEARWAVFFDTLGVKYEYEIEGYNLCDGDYYLPDFYLPDFKCFVEIKADIDSEIKKVEHIFSKLFYEIDCCLILCVGDPLNNDMRLYCMEYNDSSGGYISDGMKCDFFKGISYKRYVEDIDDIITVQFEPDSISLVMTDQQYNYKDRFFTNRKSEELPIIQKRRITEYISDSIFAKEKARQARFEYGENG